MCLIQLGDIVSVLLLTRTSLVLALRGSRHIANILTRAALQLRTVAEHVARGRASAAFIDGISSARLKTVCSSDVPPRVGVLLSGIISDGTHLDELLTLIHLLHNNRNL